LREILQRKHQQRSDLSRAAFQVPQKAVPTLGQGFDETRVFGGIAEGFAQFVNRFVEAVIEIHERIGRPKAAAQLLAGD
jgi:hypothetical protein